MERLARTRAVLAHLHEQAPAQVETGKQQVQMLSDGLIRAKVPFQISSFSVNSELASAQATPGRLSSVTDLPVLDSGLSAATTHTRISVPIPFVEPMRAATPSARRVEGYKRSMLGESMALEAHIDLAAAARGGAPRLGQARYPAPTEDSMSLADAVAASASACAHGSAAGTASSTPLAASAWDGPARFTELDVLGFRAHYEAAGRVAAAHGSEPDLALTSGRGDTGDDHIAALAAGVTAAAAEQRSHSAQLLRARRALDHVRSCAAGAALGSATRVDPLLAALAPAPAAEAPASSAADPAVQAAQYHRERARAHFTPATRELLGSLAAFRAGLAHLEQARRRRNGALNRDPADDSHLTWHRSLPGGFDSPFAL